MTPWLTRLAAAALVAAPIATPTAMQDRLRPAIVSVADSETVLEHRAPPRNQAAAPVSELLGTWRGTSVCTDRVAAPACQDETVVYEFTRGAKDGAVHWAADKIVNGKRQPMGEMDLTYDRSESCWKVEFSSPRLKTVWRLSVAGSHLTGTGRLLPGNETIRKLDLRKTDGDRF